MGQPALSWLGKDGRNFTSLARPAAPAGGLDCAVAADDGGTMYVADAFGGGIAIAATKDGHSWTAPSLALPPGAYDRPWLSGGLDGHATLVVFSAATAGMAAFTTVNGGASWEGPSPATPSGQVVVQEGGAPARMGDKLLVPYGTLSSQGDAVECRDVHVLVSPDSKSWRSFDVATHLDGNCGNNFPAAAAEAGSAWVAWAQTQRGGIRVYASSSPDGSTWSAPQPVNPDGTTALLPRLALSPRGPTVFYYEANGTLDPNHGTATWRFVAATRNGTAWTEQVLAPDAHVGNIETGGYGTLLAEAGAGQPTANARNLYDTVGATVDLSGRTWVAWTQDTGPDGKPHIYASHD
jgi:hypothetical protein